MATNVFCVKVDVVNSFEQHIHCNMSEPETQMSAINKKDKIDSKLHKFEHDIKENLSVSCRDNFNEYLFNSTLHGLRYVGDRTITRVERL